MKTRSAYNPRGTTKAYYTLSGSSTDYSGNGNNGTDTAITYPQGKFGQCAKFDGSTSRIQADDSTSLSITGNYTISVWAKPTALPGTGALASMVCKFDGVPNIGGYDFRLQESSGQKIALINGNATLSDGATIAYTLPLNTWSNLIGVYNGATCEIFVNGKSIGSAAFTYNPQDNTKKLNIGNFGYYTPTSNELGRYFSGSLDEVIIESRAWTAAEVATYYRKSMLNYKPIATRGGFMEVFTYILTCASGSFAYTGNTVGLLYNRVMSLASGAFAYTGYDTLLKRGYGMVCSAGSFAYTGYDAILTKAWKLACSAGSFAYTGYDIVINKGYTMLCAVGRFAYTGYNAVLRASNIWSNETKHSSSFTNETKNSSSWVNETKQ